MKKLIFALLLIPSLVFAGEPIDLARLGVTTVTGAGVVGGTCSAASNEVGNRTSETTADSNVAVNAMSCFKTTADCTGTLGYGYIYHKGTDSDTVKVCVYNYDGSGGPAIGDTKVGCSSATTCAANEVCKTADKLGGSVTQGNNYFICIVVGTTFEYYRNTAGAMTAYSETASSYASPPDNLDGTWGGPYDRNVTLYAEIE